MGGRARDKAEDDSDKDVDVGQPVGAKRGEEERAPDRLEDIAGGDDEAQEAEHGGRGPKLAGSEVDDSCDLHGPDEV